MGTKQKLKKKDQWFVLQALNESEKHDRNTKLEDLTIEKTSMSDITQLPYSSSIYSDVSSETNLEMIKIQSSSVDWTDLPSENKNELHDSDLNWQSLNVNNMQEVFRPEPLGHEKIKNLFTNAQPLNINDIDDISDDHHLSTSSQLSSIQYQNLEMKKNQAFENSVAQKISSPNISNSFMSFHKNVASNDHALNRKNSTNDSQKTQIELETEPFPQQYQTIKKNSFPLTSATILNETPLSSYKETSSFNQVSSSERNNGSLVNMTSSSTKNSISSFSTISNNRNSLNNNLSEQDINQAQVSTAPYPILKQNNLAESDSLFREQQVETSLSHPGVDILNHENILNHGDMSLQTLSLTSDLFDKSHDRKEETVFNESGLTRKQWSKMNFEKSEMSTSSFNSKLFTEVHSKSTNTTEIHTFPSSEDKSTSSLSTNSYNISVSMQSSWNNEKQQLNADIPFKTPLSRERNKNSLKYKPDPIIEQIAHRLNSISEIDSNIRPTINHDSTESNHNHMILPKASLQDFKTVSSISRKELNVGKHNVSDSNDLLEYKSTSSANVISRNKISDSLIFEKVKPESLKVSKSADRLWIPNHNGYVSPSITPGYKGLNQLWNDFRATKSLKTSISSSQIISKLETLQKILAQQKHSMQSLTEGMTTPESVGSFSQNLLSPEFVTNNKMVNYKQFNKAAPRVCPYCSKHNKSTNIPSIEESTLSGSQSSESPLTLQIWTQTSKLSEQHLNTNTDKKQVKVKSLKMRDNNKNDNYKIREKPNVQETIHTSSKNENYDFLHINKKSVYTAWFQSVRSVVSDIIPLCKLPVFNVLDDNKGVETPSIDTTQLNLQEAFRQHKKRFISNSKKRVQNVKDRCLEKKRRKKWFAAKKYSAIKLKEKPVQKQQNKKRLNFQQVGFQQLQQERIAQLKSNRIKMKQFDIKIRQRFILHKLTMKSHQHVPLQIWKWH